MKQLYTNGIIFTSNANCLYADSMLVEDGIIRRVGNCGGEMDDCCSDMADDIIDLGGRTVIPGFVDAHMHPMMLAEYSRQIACMPPRISSIKDLAAEIARVSDAAPEGAWVRGWGYDESKFAEKRSPNRYDLDRGSKDHPVFIVRCCEHIRCVNSKALEIAGIDRNTPDPPGGRIDRDENGEPTGILRESARNLVLPFLPEETMEETVDALVDLGQLLRSQGIVAIADMGNLHPGSNYELFAKAAKRGFCQRVSLYYMWDYFRDDPDFQITEELMDPGKRIRIAGLKLIGDGSVSGRTAWVREPYLQTSEYGMPVYADEDMESAIAFAKKYGCQVAVHAMGGRTIDRALDRFCRETRPVSTGRGCTPQFRIEHVTEPSEDAMRRAAENGIAFVSQPIFEYCEIETYRMNLGSRRLTELYPYRNMLDRGVRLAFSTDAPATSWAVPSDPFINIKAAVTRKACDGTDTGQPQRVDIETAVILYTKAAAEVCGFTGIGQLAPGYSADFTVLSDDIFTIAADDIDRIEVEETYISGAQVFTRKNT